MLQLTVVADKSVTDRYKIRSCPSLVNAQAFCFRKFAANGWFASPNYNAPLPSGLRTFFHMRLLNRLVASAFTTAMTDDDS